MKKITLEDIKAWMDAQLAETQDAEERKEIEDKAKLQAFYLGALDKYARVTKEPYGEFWEEQSQEGYEYKVGRLPEWGSPCADDFSVLPCADDFSGLEDAYDKGEDAGESYAEEYEHETLVRLAADAEKECILMDEELSQYPGTDAGKEAYARAKQHRDELLRRYHSDECGWGANWWED